MDWPGPFGGNEEAVWRALAEQPMTRSQLAQALHLSYGSVRHSIQALVEAGSVTIVGRISTARRPAQLYASSSSEPAGQPQQLDSAFHSLVRIGRG